MAVALAVLDAVDQRDGGDIAAQYFILDLRMHVAEHGAVVDHAARLEIGARDRVRLVISTSVRKPSTFWILVHLGLERLHGVGAREGRGIRLHRSINSSIAASLITMRCLPP